MFPLRSTALALCLGAFVSAAPSSAAVLRLGVVTTTEPGFAATTVTPVVSQMEKLRPDDVVHVVQIAEHDLLHGKLPITSQEAEKNQEISKKDGREAVLFGSGLDGLAEAGQRQSALISV